VRTCAFGPAQMKVSNPSEVAGDIYGSPFVKNGKKKVLAQNSSIYLVLEKTLPNRTGEMKFCPSVGIVPKSLKYHQLVLNVLF